MGKKKKQNWRGHRWLFAFGQPPLPLRWPPFSLPGSNTDLPWKSHISSLGNAYRGWNPSRDEIHRCFAGHNAVWMKTHLKPPRSSMTAFLQQRNWGFEPYCFSSTREEKYVRNRYLVKPLNFVLCQNLKFSLEKMIWRDPDLLLPGNNWLTQGPALLLQHIIIFQL